MSTIEWLIFVGGVLHLGTLVGAALVPLVVDFRGQLKSVSELMRQLVWVYATFIFLTVLGFGIVSVTFTGALADGTPLARAVCGFVAIFWAVRLATQFFVFNPKPYLTNWFLTCGYNGLTLVFIYHSIVYTYAAIAPISILT